MESSTPREQKKLSIRKSATGPAEPISPMRPTPPPPPDRTPLATALAIAASIIVLVCLFQGFTHLRERVKEVAEAESRSAASVKERDELKRKMDELALRLERINADFSRQEEQEKNELIRKLKNQYETALTDLRTKIAEVKTQGAMDMAAEQAKIDGLRQKLDALERENREMRAWLSVNHKTVHP